MADWYKIPLHSRVTEREYRANVDGINIVFGAVLGFVLAGSEDLPPIDFMILLFTSATVVISILYLSSSEYKLFYGLMTAALIWFLPRITTEFLEIETIPALQPTLAVWAAMVLLVEMMPRHKPDKLIQSEEEDPIP